MCQNECFRKLNIYGAKDEIINTIDKTADWRFIDKINHCGIYRYHFANDKLGAEVLFEDCDTYFRCSNVFPLDKKTFQNLSTTRDLIVANIKQKTTRMTCFTNYGKP